MQAIKIKNFIVQLLLTPISLIINALAITPIISIIIFEQIDMNIGTMIFMIPICFGLAFFLNRLIFRAKGKKVDESYEVIYYGVDTNVKEYIDYYEVTFSPYAYEGYETKLTPLGWLATALCFIAFPLRIISLLVSYIALFIPHIYSSFRKLSDGASVGRSAAFTHTFFDFVIVPTRKRTDVTRSPKGLIFVAVYIVTFIIVNLGMLLILSNFTLPNVPEFIDVILFLLIAFFLISDLIMLIKYCILICFTYSVKNAVMCLIKLLSLPLILIILCTVLGFLPFESWGISIS